MNLIHHRDSFVEMHRAGFYKEGFLDKVFNSPAFEYPIDPALEKYTGEEGEVLKHLRVSSPTLHCPFRDFRVFDKRSMLLFARVADHLFNADGPSLRLRQDIRGRS